MPWLRGSARPVPALWPQWTVASPIRGFSSDKTGELALPGPFERARLLALELRGNALDGARGMIVPTGALTKTTRAKKATRSAPRAA